MKKTVAFLFFNLLCTLIAVAQIYKGQIDSTVLPSTGPAHYIPEYDDDVCVNPQAWTAATTGMHVAFGSEDELYFRKEAPSITNEAAIWHAIGWKGERLNTQIAVWSADTLQQVRFTLHDLTNEKGQLLSKRNIQLHKVCYVLGNFPYGSKEPDCNGTPYKNGFLLPDRFEAFDRFDVPGKTVRPVWLSLNIPSDAAPGTYTGTIEVNAKNANTTLNVKVRVQNQTLPRPHDWQYRFDLWQNPWVIADYYHVKPWSDEHKALLREHMQLYADAGGTYITTYAIHSPWGDNEYAIEGGMIEWIKQKNGTWKFDYDIFDQYVTLAMSMGIDKAITIYTPLPWGDRYRYMDEATGNYVYEHWPPASDTFKNNWNIFLTDLRAHLEKKGWFNKTYIGINENPMEQTLAAIKAVKAHSKDWKITYAGNWHQQLDTLLTDYCFLYGNEANMEQIKERTKRGQTTTYYVACGPAKPNTFVFSPPVEGRWISWYAMAHGYNGFLRWAYDAWPNDPMRDARYGSWAAGDCYLVYPGGNSCIRFEKLREGIVDYEKIRILRELAARSADATIKSRLTALNAHLQTLNMEKTFNEAQLKEEITKGKELIDALSEELGK
jgi:hypothetical protein